MLLRLLPGLVALVAVPFLLPDHLVYLACMVGTTAITAAGLTIVTGLAGQLSLGQAAFAALGGYGTAQLAAMYGVPHWIGLPAFALVASALGYVFGLLSLRVADHYLALATMAVTAVVQLVLVHAEGLTGGAVGLPVPPLTFWDRELASPQELYAVIAPVLVLTLLAIHRLKATKLGRAFAAFRTSEIAANSLGVPLLHTKSLAFALSAFFGAVGGGLAALLTTYLDPAAFDIFASVRLLAVAVVGGMQSAVGPLIGSAIFVLMPEFLGEFGRALGLIFSILLLAFILLAPNGITGILGTAVRRFGR